MRGQVLQCGAYGRRVPWKSPGNAEGLETGVLADQQPEVGTVVCRTQDRSTDHLRNRAALNPRSWTSQVRCTQIGSARHVESSQRLEDSRNVSANRRCDWAGENAFDRLRAMSRIIGIRLECSREFAVRTAGEH
jgi:hypothetical protein